MTNRNHPSILSLSLLLTLGGVACGDDDGGPVVDPPGSGACAVEANFTSIHGLLSSGTCANAGCHGAAPSETANGNLVLSGSKDEVHAVLVGVASDDPSPEVQASYPLRVEAGSSSTSFLYHQISEAMPVGRQQFQQMPVGSTLDDCSIEAIRVWIDGGAPND